MVQQAALGLSIERHRTMADSENKIRVGPDAYWDMMALVIEGRMASCESCLGLYYFLDDTICRIFLESCAAAGLMERYSLLELKPEAESGAPGAKKWYDQAIYIPAPRLRRLNPDFARRKVQHTANAVYKAFFIYYELLGANDAAISAAYVKAVNEDLLRNTALARSRHDVRLSPIVQLRLIFDGIRLKESEANETLPEPQQLSSWEIEKLATNKTAAFVLSAGSALPDIDEKFDRGEELDKFITGFLVDPFRLKEFARDKSRELPEEFHVQLLLLISELCLRRYEMLSHDRDEAARFVRDIRNAVEEAKVKHSGDQDYLAALSDFAGNLNSEQLPAFPFVSADQLGSTFASVGF